ncbi:PPC domain-containing DNA-binding protein [Paracoccus sp. NGMCC 1.201697]|uniref:PPC domain-containing DNA-binding protein n=1 Tax=Paracoccus broussonetiae subsp. drimophilus TaxID=3373869 RepID=A0ABW7LLC2_9RHOB
MDPHPQSAGVFMALRLKPGDDPVAALRLAFDDAGVRAMAVVTCVGSLTRAILRHANRDAATVHDGHFEITSMVGTIDPQRHHLHLSIADGVGQTFGGHLLPGSVVYTTAEIVVLLLPELSFSREPCALSGYDELVIRPMRI